MAERLCLSLGREVSEGGVCAWKTGWGRVLLVLIERLAVALGGRRSDG